MQYVCLSSHYTRAVGVNHIRIAMRIPQAQLLRVHGMLKNQYLFPDTLKFELPLFALLVGVAAQSIIIDDINQRISPQVTKLTNDVAGFPESGIGGALVGPLWALSCPISYGPQAIDLDSKELAIIFDSATVNARNEGSFSPNDGIIILADLSLQASS